MGSPMENLDLTPIQQFYNNCNVFITGASGFIGRILLEKLLRSCPVSKIYILIRQKKGKDTKSRTKEILDDLPFQKLLSHHPELRHKVIGIDGDCSLPNLGLSLEDMETLKRKVNIIFHLAATVNFTEKLRTATYVNVRATRDILSLAHSMPHLKVIMHVSTTYANCVLKVIEEKIYPTAFDGNAMIAMAEHLPDKILDSIADKLIGEHPNTYTFTKQIAEGIVKENGYGLPIGIHRPGLTLSTYKEPIKSWINHKYSATGVVAYAGLGLIRAIHGDTCAKSNVVPVDMCMNSLITAAWDVGTAFETAKKQKEVYQTLVYNYESNSEKPINWGPFFEKTFSYGLETPCSKTIWFHCFKIHKNTFMYNTRTFFLHTMPAFVLDLISFCTGKPPTMMKIYSKLHKFNEVLSYFGRREWTYKSNNVRRVIDKMSDKDKKMFPSDIRKVDWDEFLKTYFYGIRLYVLKDPKETIPDAKKKWQRLFWVHQFLSFIIGLSLLWLVWCLLKSRRISAYILYKKCM